MNHRQLSILAACLGWAALICGCGAPETPPVVETTRPASSSEHDDVATRTRIARMYEGYRAEAFAGAGEIEVDDLIDGQGAAPFLLVDCREDRERYVSMIDGAISQAEFEADPARYADRLIVPYCTIGYRSGVYTKALAERGFNAKNLVGGVLVWAHEGRSFTDADGNEVERVHVYGAEWDLLPEHYESVYEGKPSS